ncbi:MAG: hypothetical protein OES47_13435, partial [Acidobacteriota bacterium]|nr:hypothetical protein [Acidobacteriota bacterium]
MVLVLAVTQDKKLDKKIRDALGGEGWWVSQVEDSQSALRSAADHEPHLVLVDEDVNGADDLVRVFGSKSGGPGAVVLSHDGESARTSPDVDAVLKKTTGSDQLLASVKKVMTQPHSPIAVAEMKPGAILTAEDIFADVLREVADDVLPPAALPDPPPIDATNVVEVGTHPAERQLKETVVEIPEEPTVAPMVEIPEEPAEETTVGMSEETVAETSEKPDVEATFEISEETVEQPAVEVLSEATADIDGESEVGMAVEPIADAGLEAEVNSGFESEVVDPSDAAEVPVGTVEIPAELLATAGLPDSEPPESVAVDSQPVWPTEDDKVPDLPPPLEPSEPVEFPEPLGSVTPDVLPEPLPPRSMKLPEPTQGLESPIEPALPSLELVEPEEGTQPAPGVAAASPKGERTGESRRGTEGGVGWKRFWLGVAAGLLVFAATSLLLRVTFGGGDLSPGGTRGMEQGTTEGAQNTTDEVSSELEELVAEELARRETELRR